MLRTLSYPWTLRLKLLKARKIIVKSLERKILQELSTTEEELIFYIQNGKRE